MQVVKANLEVTTGMHLLETPEDIIINSQVYDKATMQPTANQFFNINNDCELLAKLTSLTDNEYSRIHKPADYNHILQDADDIELFYIINRSVLYQLRKHDGVYSITKSCQIDEENHMNMKFLGQTERYVLCATNALESKTISVVKIDKQSFEYTEMISETFESEKIMVDYYTFRNDENYIYFYVYKSCSNEECGVIIYQGNINTNEVIEIHKNTWDYSLAIGKCAPTTFNDYYHILVSDEEGENYEFLRYHINFDGEVDERRFAVSHEIVKMYLLENLEMQADDNLCFTLQNINNEYIACVIHSAESIQKTNTTPMYKILLFKPEGDGLKCIYVYSFGRVCYGALFYDESTILAHTTSGYRMYQLNTTTEKYQSCYERTGSFKCIGIDEMNRIYNIEDDNRITITSNITACTLEANFQKNSYEYNGSSFYTAVEFYAKNFYNTYITTKAELILDGPCQFSDGTKRKTVTITTGVNSEAVRIYGPGKVDVIIKQVGVD